MLHSIPVAFAHYFEDFRDRVFDLANRVPDEQFFEKPFPYGNSFGNLVLHLTGNLNYYIGTQIENTGYIRDRELEFAFVTNGNKAMVLSDFSETVSMVVNSLNCQIEEDWSREYHAIGADDVNDRFSIYLRCCVHFHHHIGQMIYIVKEWSEKTKGNDRPNQKMR